MSRIVIIPLIGTMIVSCWVVILIYPIMAWLYITKVIMTGIDGRLRLGCALIMRNLRSTIIAIAIHLIQFTKELLKMVRCLGFPQWRLMIKGILSNPICNFCQS